MGVVNTTYTFTSTDTITSAKMNNIIDETTFTSDAIQGSTLQVVSPGKLAVSAGGITSNEMAANSVVTAAITDLNVTTAKIANLNVTTAKIADANVTSAKIAPNITITSLTAGTVTSTGTLIAGEGIGASDANILIGYNRTTAGNSGIFFYTDSTLSADAYMQRASGTNGNLAISNAGTGNFLNTGSARYGYNTASPTNTHHFVGALRNTSGNSAGAGTTLVIDGSGDIRPASSSLRYKNSIENYSKGLDELNKLNPVTFKYNGEDIINAGFIAEELDSLGFNEYVYKNSDGQPESIKYETMVALLVNAIKEQQQQIDDLEKKV
jgi:hypothetical protein